MFEDVHLEWSGMRYTIPANRIMGAIACVEQHITLEELLEDSSRRKVRRAALAAGYAALLNYAGASVKDQDVYAEMFKRGSALAATVSAMQGLLGLMIPPSIESSSESADAQGGAPGKQQGRAGAAAASSSRKRSS